ncbi:MAG: N-6 DNA methylase [Nitrosopumilaceae archaeon]|nr:N-6 DNA methylase [Nitrosopumilaceae archaeon]
MLGSNGMRGKGWDISGLDFKNGSSYDHSIKLLITVYAKDYLVNCMLAMFIADNNITTTNRTIRKRVKNVAECDVKYVKNTLRCDRCELVHVQKVLECVVESSVRQRYGVVYTPTIITEYITRKSIGKGTRTVCDPACGTGVFLLSAVKRIHQLSGRRVSDIIENSIFGADILEEHITYTKIVLILYMLYIGEDKQYLNFNLNCCDSLTFDWKNAHPAVSTGFDAVIGNPPYIRIQDMENVQKTALRTRWRTCTNGSYNIYFAFFELGVGILSSTGTLGYVTSNNFFTSFAGKNLRGWMQENRYVRRILDFTHLILFEATSYTCIVFLDRRKKNGIGYNYVTEYNDLVALNSIKFDINPYHKLRYEKWRLLKSDEREIIEKIESTGRPLGMVSDIHSGIATLKDKVFLLPYSDDEYIEKIYAGRVYRIESSITRNIIKIPDLGNKPSQALPTNKIVFPYRKVSKRYEPLPERELKDVYPGCYQYLCANKTVLLKRDGGKQNGRAWYAYGRSQGFDTDGRKLLTPTFSIKPRFHFDDNGNSFFCNGYAICNSDIPLIVIQKILNSNVLAYYITKTSVSVAGGYGCFQKNFIERFGIPDLTDMEIERIEDMTDQDHLEELLAEKYNISALIYQ